jgi:ribonuclease D
MTSSSPLIDTPAALEDLVAHLSRETVLGMDTEFLRERTYRAELCLLQVTGPAGPVCIDPIALVELSPLSSLAGDAGTQKILHSGRQDLEVLWPVIGRIQPVFDTQIAAALAGFAAQIGYADLVRRLLDIELPKGQTRTDWSRRPLSAEQVVYALDDVRYLKPLHDQLTEQLDRLGRTAWLQEDLLKLTDPVGLLPDPSRAWQRFKGVSNLDPGRQRLLAALAEWRERRAIAKNRPRGWILDDALIKEITETVPRDIDALSKINAMPEGVIKHSGEELCALILAAEIEHPPPPLPKRARPDPAILQEVKRLTQTLKQLASDLDIASEVLATRKELEALASGRPVADVFGGWRKELLADVLKP